MAKECRPFYSYKEVRLSTEPANASSTVSIRISNNHGSSRPTLIGDQPRGIPKSSDETIFAKSCLASSAGIYFRQSKKHPRSFLWRVLDGGRVLSLQCLDLSKSSSAAADTPTVVRLSFSSPIRPAGVAFADWDKHNTLYAFIVTEVNDLYTLALPAQFFHQHPSTQETTEDWCNNSLLSSFSFRYPHRLIARSPEELLVSLHDGGLLRLTREKDGSDPLWIETSFNEGGWGTSLRGLIPWQGNHTVRFGNVNLEHSTGTALSFAPSLTHAEGIPEHVYVVCLNHTIKAWNLSTGKIGFTRDLLNQSRTPRDMGRFLIDPARTSLMAIIDQKLRGERDRHYLITFSPVGQGEFKFWAVVDPDCEETGIEDLYPGQVFEPPPPSSEIWTVAEFQVSSGSRPGLMKLWILWKNNTQYRIQSLDFDLLNLPKDWLRTWAATTGESFSSEPLPIVSASHSSDATEKWVAYILYPGRFTEAVLDTSLSIYQQNLNFPNDDQGNIPRSLRERICATVGSSTSLVPDADGGMDFHRYRIDVDFQWRRFYRIVVELDKQRGEALSLAYDGYSDLAWVVGASGAVAIRDCSITELIWHNKLGLATDDEASRSCQPELPPSALSTEDVQPMAGLIKAATIFRECFSDSLLEGCETFLDSECFIEAALSVPIRIQNFYDRCNFIAHISDEDIRHLKSALEEVSIRQINTELFQSILGLFPQDKQEANFEVAMTRFGQSVVVRGMQEVVYLSGIILFDLLMLLVFIAIDESFGSEEEWSEGAAAGQHHEIRHEINVPEVYLELMALIKAYKLLGWLATTEETGTTGQVALKSATAVELREVSEALILLPKTPTLLQIPCVRKWRPRWAHPRQPMSWLLTSSLDGLVGSMQLQQAGSYKHQILKAQLYYVSRGELDLAASLMRFQSSTAWSVYLLGRICLARSEHIMAALHLRRAGYKLAKREGQDLALIQDPENILIEKREAQKFAAGLHGYYYHVIQLFDTAKAHSQVVEFSRYCLQLANTMPNDDSSRKLYTNLHSQLFRSALTVSSFDTAYSALMLTADRTTQLSHLNSLIHAMCHPSASASSRLFSYPLLTLQNELDAILHDLAQLPHQATMPTTTGSTTLLKTVPGPYSASTDASLAGTDWSSLLYTLRISRSDFRGAAQVLHERLLRLRSHQPLPAEIHSSDRDQQLERGYLALINTLASVDPNQAWILSTPTSPPPPVPSTSANQSGPSIVAEPQQSMEVDLRDPFRETPPLDTTENGNDAEGHAHKKRTVITLADVRREWQLELDRREKLEGGRFAFDAGDGVEAMQIDAM